MPPEIHDPVSYSVLLLVAAAILAVLAIGWPLAVIIGHRLRSPKPEPVVPAAPPPPPPDPVALRASYLGQIEQIAAAHAAGRLPDRGVHQQLSGVVREFVAEVSAIPVDRLTLAELERQLATQPQLASLTGFVAELYSPSFAADVSRPAAASLASARQVVERWN